MVDCQQIIDDGTKKIHDQTCRCIYPPSIVILDDDKTMVEKAEQLPATAKKLKVRSVINTTKIFDSHHDVHIDQLWNKSHQ